jgi:hypothetical protein
MATPYTDGSYFWRYYMERGALGTTAQAWYPNTSGVNVDIYDNPFTIAEFWNQNYLAYSGDYNSTTSDIDNYHSVFGAMGRFKNNKVDTWEQFKFSFNLNSQHMNSPNEIKDLFFIVQSSGTGLGNSFRGRVLLDDFEVQESYDFLPDCDARKKKGPNDYGIADLTKYWDPELQPEEYNDSLAPAEVQFYFYPRYHQNNFSNKELPIIHNDFRNNMFYLYDVDWGDGSVNDFSAEPKLLGENISVHHTYENSGIYEVTGTMLRMKPDLEYNPLGVIHNERFSFRININEDIDEDFRYFGSEAYSYIPYKSNLPVVGGYSEESIYYKSIKRQLGFIDDINQIQTEFKKPSDRLKTELALNKMDSSYNNELNLLNEFKKERYLQIQPNEFDCSPLNYGSCIGDEGTSHGCVWEDAGEIYNSICYCDDSDLGCSNELTYGDIINSGIKTYSGQLGKSIGDTDITNIRYYDKPKEMWEMLGFESDYIQQMPYAYWEGDSYQVKDETFRNLKTLTGITTLDMTDFPKTEDGKVDGYIEIVVDIGNQTDYYIDSGIEITRGGNIGGDDCNSDGCTCYVNSAAVTINNGSGWQQGENTLILNLPDCNWKRDDCTLSEYGSECGYKGQSGWINDGTSHTGCITLPDTHDGYQVYDQGYDFTRLQFYRNGDTDVSCDTTSTGGTNTCPYIEIKSFTAHPNPEPFENIQEMQLNHPANPASDRYWKNIIPKDYSIFNREGIGTANETISIGTDGLGVDNYALQGWARAWQVRTTNYLSQIYQGESWTGNQVCDSFYGGTCGFWSACEEFDPIVFGYEEASHATGFTGEGGGGGNAVVWAENPPETDPAGGLSENYSFWHPDDFDETANCDTQFGINKTLGVCCTIPQVTSDLAPGEIHMEYRTDGPISNPEHISIRGQNSEYGTRLGDDSSVDISNFQFDSEYKPNGYVELTLDLNNKNWWPNHITIDFVNTDFFQTGWPFPDYWYKTHWLLHGASSAQFGIEYNLNSHIINDGDGWKVGENKLKLFWKDAYYDTYVPSSNTNPAIEDHPGMFNTSSPKEGWLKMADWPDGFHPDQGLTANYIRLRLTTNVNNGTDGLGNEVDLHALQFQGIPNPSQYYTHGDYVGKIYLKEVKFVPTQTIDIYSEQNWRSDYYYPVLPKHNSTGEFIDHSIYDASAAALMEQDTGKIPFPFNGEITEEDLTDGNLKISINNETVESNVFNDSSGNSNYAFAYGDYRPEFDKVTLEPKKNRSKTLFKTSKRDGAF